MRFLILALCSLIFWNCYTVPYKSPARTFPQQEYAPEEMPGYRLSLYESVFSKEIGGYITFDDIIYNIDSSNATLVLRVEKPPKTSVIHIKPRLGKKQFIGDYNDDYKAYIIFKDVDLVRKRIRFQTKFSKPMLMN